MSNKNPYDEYSFRDLLTKLKNGIIEWIEIIARIEVSKEPENINEENKKFLLEIIESRNDDFFCDAVEALGYYRGMDLLLILPKIAKDISEDSKFRCCIIEMYFKRALRDNGFFSLIYGILENELNRDYPNINVLQKIGSLMFNKKEKLPDEFVKKSIKCLLESIRVGLHTNILSTMIEIFGDYTIRESLPILYEYKEIEELKTTVENAIINIGYSTVIEEIKKSNDSVFVSKVLEEFIERRRNLPDDQRQKYWKIPEEEIVSSLYFLLINNDNESIRIKAADAIGYFGKLAIQILEPLEKLYSHTENYSLKIILQGSINKIKKAFSIDADSKSMRQLSEISKCKIGIITAIKEEKKAINELITNLDSRKDKDNRIYYSGIVDEKLKNYEIYHYFAGKGSKVISDTKRLLNYHNVEFVFLVGIAAGITDEENKYGDIIVATNVHYYEIGDMKDDSFIIFLESAPTDKTLQSHFRNFPDGEDELNQITILLEFKMNEEQKQLIGITDTPYDISKRKKMAAFFCGEKIIENSPKFIEKLKEKDRRGKAIDMESWHVLECCLEDRNKPSMIIIKAISDYANKPNRKIRKKLRYTSARLAAGYLFAYLKSGKLN